MQDAKFLKDVCFNSITCAVWKVVSSKLLQFSCLRCEEGGEIKISASILLLRCEEGETKFSLSILLTALRKLRRRKIYLSILLFVL